MEKMRTALYERAVYPAYQFKYGLKYGYNVIKLLKYITNSQWLSQDELLKYQNVKLRKLIHHAYYNVPYYHDIMHKNDLRPEDINNVEDLKHFPILKKKQIKDNYDKIVSKDINKRNATKASTGGTTGEPLSFFRDLNTRIWTEATLLRGMSWAQYKLGDTMIDFSSSGWPCMLGKIRGKLINRYYFPAFAKYNELISFVKKIKRLQPFYLTGYASNLYRILTIWDNHKVKDIQIPVIFSTAEILYDHQRNFIEKQYNSRVFDYYGCNEIGSLAYDCEYKKKHITNEHVIIETIDSKGNNVINTSGEIIVTDLNNYAMPFIRYKNGDAGTLTNKKCRCERGLSLLKSVDGRTQDFLKTLDGNYVPAIFFPTRFRNLKGIEQYQIIQTDIHNINLKIVKNQFFSGKELKEIIGAIREMIGNEININIEEFHNIPLTGRGKKRLVISHLPTEF